MNRRSHWLTHYTDCNTQHTADWILTPCAICIWPAPLTVLLAPGILSGRDASKPDRIAVPTYRLVSTLGTLQEDDDCTCYQLLAESLGVFMVDITMIL